MIRFLPDTFLDFLLRPWYMLLPRSGVYVEITAPDVRVLVICAIFPFVLGALKGRLNIGGSRGLIALIVAFLLALLIWIATTGNGRYFMPFLAIAGPLVVAMVFRLPLSRAMRASILFILVVVQAGLVSVNPPWSPSNTLELSAWSNGSPFSLDADSFSKDQNVTYVTVMEQSYSILAPMFGGGGWINLRYFEGYDFFGSSYLFADARKRLSESKDLRLLVRSFPRSSNIENGLPNGDTLTFLGSYVRPYGLLLEQGAACQVVHSETIADTESVVFSGDSEQSVQGLRKHAGFWICPLRFVGKGIVGDESGRLRSSLGGRLIEKMEKICPKYFPAGQVTFRREGDELVRYYPTTDVRLIYSEANKKLFAKFTFVLNPVLLGDAEDIAADSFSYDCRRFVRWELF